ncbi:MAG: hypothetical protein IPN39_15285 [Chitinophagaceae bacterium]|nr:hypothetical protein [Chitinophagaceae bacterium]MBL0307840.1 hypothetical protein [Chitinophagaceae bacterium]
MTVYCNPNFSQSMWDKTVYVAKYMSGMIYHFQNKYFGEAVKEIVYHPMSGDSVFWASFGIGTTYGRKSKSIGSLFAIDYETIQSLEGEALLTYVAQQVVEETKKFADKKIKNFDLEGYIKNLEEYFSEALELMREGKNPGEGKELNEDIQLEMAKKWSKL